MAARNQARWLPHHCPQERAVTLEDAAGALSAPKNNPPRAAGWRPFALFEADLKYRMKLNPVRRDAFLSVKRIVEADTHHSDRNVGSLPSLDRPELIIDCLSNLLYLIQKLASFCALRVGRFDNHSAFFVALRLDDDVVILVRFLLDERQDSFDPERFEFRRHESGSLPSPRAWRWSKVRQLRNSRVLRRHIDLIGVSVCADFDRPTLCSACECNAD